MILIFKNSPICVHVWLIIEQIWNGTPQIVNSCQIGRWERAGVQSRHLSYKLYLRKHYFCNLKKKMFTLTHPFRSVTYNPPSYNFDVFLSHYLEFPQWVFISCNNLCFILLSTVVRVYSLLNILEVLILSFWKWTVFCFIYTKSLSHGLMCKSRTLFLSTFREDVDSALG